VGTRKGAFIYHGDPGRARWSVSGPHVLGSIVHHLVLDPRDGRTLLMAARTGHLGPTVFRSTDWGRRWQEARQPPAFVRSDPPGSGPAVDHVFWLSPGHASQPGVWWAGTSPHGLFRSDDGGESWTPMEGFNRDLLGKVAGQTDQTPDGPVTHSIAIDPRDPSRMYLGLSGGGVFESADAGLSWRPLNRGVLAEFLPEPYPEFGQDPHTLALHPLRPDRLYQQNHCGIYRLDRGPDNPEDRWERIGMRMPKKIGDIGFPLALHPRDPDTAWVFPMDGRTVWPRTSPAGKPAVYRTRDGGRSWQRQDRGLPRAQAWFTVKRQAMAADVGEPVGLYVGTTSGELWASRDEGRSWQRIAEHLPEIYSVVAAHRR
jgi:photosystem II stability/assembly factor-like uncharacterized protein